MKKLFLFLSLSIFLFNCNDKDEAMPESFNVQKSQIWHSATDKEYLDSPPEIKRMFDLVDAGVNGLMLLENTIGEFSYVSYMKYNKNLNEINNDSLRFLKINKKINSNARLSYSEEEEEMSDDEYYNLLSNTLDFNIDFSDDKVVPGGTCKVCGVGDAWGCKNTIGSWMDKNGLNTISLTATRRNKCIHISFWGNKPD